MDALEDRISAFKARLKEEPTFCAELYDYATVRLMAFKYAYYILGEEIVKDQTYDQEEKGWYVMGRAMGLLAEDETSPCVGFDESHPKAKEGIEFALKLLGRNI